MIIDLLQLLVFGVILGSILSLGAIGISLIYAIMRFAHFAHGDMMTLGAYLALIFVAQLGWPVWGALPAAVALTAVIAVAIDRSTYRWLRRKNPVILLISSLGVALVIRSAVQITWGPNSRVYEPGITLPYVVAGVRIKPDHIVIFLTAVALVIAFHLFLKLTKMGKAMRAMSDNADLARISGIDAERVVMWTWFIGGGLAAAAGVFLGLDTRLSPELGRHLLLMLFAASILGGIGKPYGAIAGGIVIGIATEMSTAFILPAYKPAVAFAIMVLVLIVRPAGILGGRN
jgi:branched-chain amino acid transport system permease protein